MRLHVNENDAAVIYDVPPRHSSDISPGCVTVEAERRREARTSRASATGLPLVSAARGFGEDLQGVGLFWCAGRCKTATPSGENFLSHTATG